MSEHTVPPPTDLVVGVDVGGTYTDLILVDSRTGGVRLAKTPTTPENQAFGVIDALEMADTPLPQVGLIVHGTTTTTNAPSRRTTATRAAATSAPEDDPRDG